MHLYASQALKWNPLNPMAYTTKVARHTIGTSKTHLHARQSYLMFRTGATLAHANELWLSSSLFPWRGHSLSFAGRGHINHNCLCFVSQPSHLDPTDCSQASPWLHRRFLFLFPGHFPAIDAADSAEDTRKTLCSGRMR